MVQLTIGKPGEMMNRRFLAIVPLAVAALAGQAQAASDYTTASAIVTPAGADSWTFTSGGWGGGGTVTGSFTGTDTDTDGQLSSFSGEVTGFAMTYSGGTIVGPFGLGSADLVGLVYDLNGGPLGDGTTLAIEGIGAVSFSSGASFVLGPGPFGLCDTGANCGVISVVPEPASWALLIAGLGLVGRRLRQRKPAAADQAA